MIFDVLDNENFMYYAANNYTNPHCTGVEEFLRDVDKFKYIKKLLSKYDEESIHLGINFRLLLNYIITVYNVFVLEAATRMLFFRVDKRHWPTIKTFLVFLRYIREDEYIEISLDQKTIDELRKI